MLVVATEDFELYHDLVGELRDRGLEFTTLEPGTEPPARTSIVLTGATDSLELSSEVKVVECKPGTARAAIDEAIAILRGGDGRTFVGIDPGEKPGVAVLSGDIVVATFQVPPEGVPAVVRDELEGAVDPLVRIGDGARLVGSRIVDELDDVPVELVDETGTTPYLGAGCRGMSDVLAAVNIARLEGERIEERTVEPTAGELQRIKERSRERSEGNRAIDGDLARRVALGELSLSDALALHRGEKTE